MRGLVIALAALLAMGQGAAAANIEKPSAINGSSYAVVYPLFDGSSGSSSFLRLFNAGGAASTFNILVVNATNGITLGSTAISVPPNASPQYPLTGSANSIFTQAGVAASATATYALYIQNTEFASAYQHVTYNGTSTLFENQSVCPTPINEKLTSSNFQVLTNVHTTALAGNNYPSVLGLHNYSANPVAVKLTAYDAVTGTSVGSTTQTIAANTTLSLAESQLETLLNFRPTSAQLHLNVIARNTNNGALPVGVTQTIRNIQLGGEINMGPACAINPAASVAPPATSSAPVAYCGTFKLPATFPLPGPFVNFTFSLSVASNGRVRGAVYGIDTSSGNTDGDTFTGLLTGTNVTLTTSEGISGIGTIQNGNFSAVFASPYGNFTVTGSQSGCS